MNGNTFSFRMHRKGEITLRITQLAFLFWFVYQSSYSLVALFFRNNPALGTAMVFALKLFFLFLIFMILLSKQIGLKRKNTGLGPKLIILFILWAGLSILWTNASSVVVAFVYWFMQFTDILIVYFFIRIESIQNIAKSTIKGFVAGSLLLGLVSIFFSTANGRIGDAEFLHPNFLGNQFAVAALLSLYMFFDTKLKNKYIWLLSFILLTSLLIGTVSKTAILGFFITLIFFWIKSKISFVKKYVILIISIGGLSVLYNKFLKIWIEYKTIADGENVQTLSGRTLIWEETWKKINERPFLGYGFMSFRDNGPDLFGIRLVHAHNEVLTIWFNLGLVGLLIAIFLYIVFLTKTLSLLKLKEYNHGLLCLLLIVYFSIRGLTEANSLLINFTLPLFYVLSVWVENEEIYKCTLEG